MEPKEHLDRMIRGKSLFFVYGAFCKPYLLCKGNMIVVCLGWIAFGYVNIDLTETIGFTMATLNEQHLERGENEQH